MAVDSKPAHGNSVEPEEAMKVTEKWNKPVSWAHTYIKAIWKRPNNLRLNKT